MHRCTFMHYIAAFIFIGSVGIGCASSILGKVQCTTLRPSCSRTLQNYTSTLQ